MAHPAVIALVCFFTALVVLLALASLGILFRSFNRTGVIADSGNPPQQPSPDVNADPDLSTPRLSWFRRRVIEYSPRTSGSDISLLELTPAGAASSSSAPASRPLGYQTSAAMVFPAVDSQPAQAAQAVQAAQAAPARDDTPLPTYEHARRQSVNGPRDAVDMVWEEIDLGNGVPSRQGSRRQR